MYEEAPGAYKIENNQTHYVFFDGKNYYESDFRIIKYLYSIYEKQNLFDYDYKNKELSITKGSNFDLSLAMDSNFLGSLAISGSASCTSKFSKLSEAVFNLAINVEYSN